jgi:hypothetical protein
VDSDSTMPMMSLSAVMTYSFSRPDASQSPAPSRFWAGLLVASPAGPCTYQALTYTPCGFVEIELTHDPHCSRRGGVRRTHLKKMCQLWRTRRRFKSKQCSPTSVTKSGDRFTVRREYCRARRC